MYKQRQSYRDFNHLIEHIIRARVNLMEGFKEEPKCETCEKVKQRDRTGEICMDLFNKEDMMRKILLSLIICLLPFSAFAASGVYDGFYHDLFAKAVDMDTDTIYGTTLN